MKKQVVRLAGESFIGSIRLLPRSGEERKRHMAEIIARIAVEDRDLLLKLAAALKGA